MRESLRARLILAQKTLLRWHRRNARVFSWRHTIRNPYEVLICETMGQQTQASRIELFLNRFLQAFPTVEILAEAKQRDVIRAWQGLGYNRRALNLHKAAQTIVRLYDAIIPDTEENLLALPGVGPYTARAILVFAFKKQVSAVDVNVSRVLTRLSKKVKTTSEILATEKVQTINIAILPKRNNREWHEALMDLGATICIKRNPKCSICPLNTLCPSSSLESKKSASAVIKKTSTEKIYFGQPKRIWRGRILAFIASTKKKTFDTICEFTAKKYMLKPSDASSICTVVIKELTGEGFITKRADGSYELA